MRPRDWESFEHFSVISMVDKNRVRRGDKSIGHGQLSLSFQITYTISPVNRCYLPFKIYSQFNSPPFLESSIY